MNHVHEGLVLGDKAEQLLSAPWAGILVALGARLARQLDTPFVDQIVIVITVPVRDYAAVLVGIGWTLTRAPDVLSAPTEEFLRRMPEGIPVRMSTPTQIIVDRFHRVVDAPGGLRIQIGSSKWRVDAARFVEPDPALSDDRFGRVTVPVPGSFSRKARAADNWLSRQSAPRAHTLLVGTKAWLEYEMNAYIGWGDDSDPDQIRNILLPEQTRSGTWASSVLSAQSAQEIDPPRGTEIAILDGSSAVRWLSELTVPIVVAIIDRNAQDSTAAESIAQLRSRSTPVQLAEFGWRASSGIGALGFRRPL